MCQYKITSHILLVVTIQYDVVFTVVAVVAAGAAVAAFATTVLYTDDDVANYNNIDDGNDDDVDDDECDDDDNNDDSWYYDDDNYILLQRSCCERFWFGQAQFWNTSTCLSRWLFLHYKPCMRQRLNQHSTSYISVMMFPPPKYQVS